jgi:pyrroline-5-carboxylate reductase
MKYGFLGCGNMGGAIATALSKSTKDIFLASRSKSSAEALAQKLGCSARESNEEIVSSCDVIFLAVKPQMMQAVLAPLVELLQLNKPVLVSMAAGLTVARIEAMAGGNLPVMRIMPNTPVSIGCGMTTYCHNSLVDKAQVDSLLYDLRLAGYFDEVEETQMDAATAAAGCSPAYTYMFIDAIAQGAAACGLPREKALQYAAHTLLGTAQLLLETGKHPGVLKDEVCSPGGSTIQGVLALEAGGFRAAAADAVASAFEKTKELGK